MTNLHSAFLTHKEDAARAEDISFLRAIIQKMYDAVESMRDTFLKGEGGKEQIARIEDSVREKENKRKDIEREIEHEQKEEIELEKKRVELQKNFQKNAGEERESERRLFELRNKKIELAAKINIIMMRESQIHTRAADFESFVNEARALVGVISYTVQDTKDPAFSLEPQHIQDERKIAIMRIKIKLEEIGVGGGEIIKEYNETKERDEFLEKEISDLEKSAGSLFQLIKDLDEKIDDQFKSGVQKINKNFQELFSIMFGGGKASISIIKELKSAKKRTLVEELSDEGIAEGESEEHEPEEGLDISVSLPRKKVKGLMMLSGGERALTSIALIFAMTKVNPPPFLILDETDAALDEVNSRKYGDMLKNLSQETELILITHNRETMAHAGVLYGVAAVEGISRLLSVKFDEAKELTET